MRVPVSRWVRERPVFTFYVLAFAITWSGWVPQALHSHGLFPSIARSSTYWAVSGRCWPPLS